MRSTRGLIATIAYGFAPGAVTYALEGSVFVTGAAVQWLRDGLGIVDAAADTARLAREADEAGRCWFVPAFTGLGAPYWDPYARGAIVGITRGTTRAHLVRAALEAMALQTADVVGAMEADAGFALHELRVDGAAAANDFTMQFQADVLGIPVVRPALVETTAIGAAYLAGVQAGWWEAVASIGSQEHARFAPALAPPARAALLAQWRRAVERSRGWAL